LWEAIHPRRKRKLQKPTHHCMKKPATVSQKLIGRDATNPEQKAVTDYKEQVDRNTSPTPLHPPEN